MSNRIKAIIAALLVLAIMVGLLLAVNLWPTGDGIADPSGNSSTTASGNTSSETPKDMYGYIELITYKPEQVESVVAKNDKGGFDLTQTQKDQWVLKGFEKYIINDSNVSTLATACTSFAGKRELVVSPKQEDFETYGLVNCTEAVITFIDGETFSIIAGDMTPAGDRYVYVKEYDTIYTTEGGWASVFDMSESQYLTLYVTDAMDTDENGETVDPYVKKISYTGRGAKKPVVVEINPEYETAIKDETISTSEITFPKYMYTAPLVAEIADESFSGRETEYLGLVAYDAYKLKPTAADIKKAGLDDPFLTIEITSAKRKDTILLGNTVEIDGIDFYYVKNPEKEPIFLVSKSYFSFFEEDPINYISAIVVNVPINEIDTMIFEHEGKKYEFETTGTGEKLVIRYDGKKMSTTEYRDLYQLVMLVYCEDSVTAGQYSGDASLKITYTYRDREKTDTIEYVKVTARRYLIRKNGNDIALARSTYFDTLVKGLKLYVAGKDVPSDY